MAGYPRAMLARHIAACLPTGRGVRMPEIVYSQLGWQAAVWGALEIDVADQMG